MGPIIAGVTYTAVGDGKEPAKGRHYSAWLGLVPSQYSSVGKSTLLVISKRGNRYLRTLYIHRARAVLRHSANKTDKFSCWAQALKARRGQNKACVAVANKLAQIACVIMASATCRPAL